jgi:hypothetical protein
MAQETVCWRSGGVERPHDTPPYPFMPSPTSAYSSDGATMIPRTPRQPARARRELTSTFEIERRKRRVLRPEDVKKSAIL